MTSSSNAAAESLVPTPDEPHAGRTPEAKRFAISAEKLARWVEADDYKGYDPGDGLNSFLHVGYAWGNHFDMQWTMHSPASKMNLAVDPKISTVHWFA